MGITYRRAAFSDQPRLLEVMEDAQARSCFAGAQIDYGRAKMMLQHCIGMSGQARPGNSSTFVAEGGGQIQAFLVGTIAPLYECLNINLATDLIWYARAEADPRAAIGVLRHFHQWAAKCPGTVLIRHGITDAICDHERTGLALRRAGFRQCGAIYEKELTR